MKVEDSFIDEQKEDEKEDEQDQWPYEELPSGMSGDTTYRLKNHPDDSGRPPGKHGSVGTEDPKISVTDDLKTMNDREGQTRWYHNFGNIPIPSYTTDIGMDKEAFNKLRESAPHVYSNMLHGFRSEAKEWHRENMGNFPFIRFHIPGVIDEYLDNPETAKQYLMEEGVKYDMEGKESKEIEDSVMDEWMKKFNLGGEKNQQ